MAWSEPEVMCKKHPDQRQQPGVCSSCLREKLAKLPTFTFTMVPSRYSSSVSSSSSSTGIMSPTKNINKIHGGTNYRRNSSALVITGDSDSGTNGFGVVNGRNGLMRKSRSITYVARRRGRNGGGGDGKKKKEGFWSKLLRSTSMKTKGVFVHSNKTAKERPFEH